MIKTHKFYYELSFCIFLLNISQIGCPSVSNIDAQLSCLEEFAIIVVNVVVNMLMFCLLHRQDNGV